MSDDTIVLVMMLIGVMSFAFTFVTSIALIGDDGDMIDTQEMGQQLCEAKGLEYDYRDFNSDT